MKTKNLDRHERSLLRTRAFHLMFADYEDITLNYDEQRELGKTLLKLLALIPEDAENNSPTGGFSNGDKTKETSY